MKITMNLAEQKSIEKIWIVLQEIQEKREILQNDDGVIDFPKEPSGFYLKALLEIEGGQMRLHAIADARVEIIRGLVNRGVINIVEEDETLLLGAIRFKTTEKFDDFYKEIEKKYNAIRKTAEIEPKVELPLGKQKVKLGSEEIKFNDEKAIIEIGNKKCPLPPYKNEHYFCRAVFEYPVNEPIDWSIIYEKMTGYYETYYGKPPEIRENWRLVYDTMRAVNERIKEIINTDDNLFTWQEKTLKRNY